MCAVSRLHKHTHKKNLRFNCLVKKLAFDFSPASVTLKRGQAHIHSKYTPDTIYTHQVNTISPCAHRSLFISHPLLARPSCIYMHMCCLITSSDSVWGRKKRRMIKLSVKKSPRVRQAVALLRPVCQCFTPTPPHLTFYYMTTLFTPRANSFVPMPVHISIHTTDIIKLLPELAILVRVKLRLAS